MRLVLLGDTRNFYGDNWKCHIAEGARVLGWSVAHRNARNASVSETIELCKGADLFIWARTHSHDPSGKPEWMVREIAANGTKTVGMHFDLYFGIPARERRLAAAWTKCQFVLTADGGHEDRFAAMGINHVWCPPAMSDHWWGLAEPSGKYSHDAVFVGRHIPDIHGKHRKDLITWASRKYGKNFMHYGVGKNHVYGAESSDLYASVPIIVGDSAFSPQRYWSDRIPRTLGRGGVLAHSEVIGMTKQGLIDGETLITYPRGDFETLGAKLDSLTDVDIKRIRANALQVVKDHHLWSRRLDQIARLVMNS